MSGFVPPAVTIAIALEEPVQVRWVLDREGDQLRLVDWIRNHPEIAELIDLALELEREAA